MPTLDIYRQIELDTMAGLARHVDPDELVKKLHDHPIHKAGRQNSRAISHTTPYSSRYAASTELSKFRIPHDGAPADVVHQLLKDELDLDGVSYVSSSFPRHD